MAWSAVGSYRSFSWGPGTGVKLINPEGLDSLPAARTSDVDRPQQDGAWSGRSFLPGREMQWGYRILVNDAGTFDSLIRTVNAASRQPTDAQLASYPKGFPLLFDGGRQVIFAWLRETDMPRTPPTLQKMMEFTVRYFAPDPHKYSAALHSIATGLGSVAGGLVFPATFPATFGSGSAGGTVQVENLGTADAPALFTIAGPVDNPIIDHVELGRSLQMTISLGSGDTLALDTDARSVILNGTASRESSLTLPQWFLLPPGVSTVVYRNNGAFTASQLAIAWRDCWL